LPIAFWFGLAQSIAFLPALPGFWSWTVVPWRCPAARPRPSVLLRRRRFFSFVYCHIGVQTAQILAATAQNRQASSQHAYFPSRTGSSVLDDGRRMYVAGHFGWLCHFPTQSCRQWAFSYANSYGHADPWNDSNPDTNTNAHPDGCGCSKEFGPAISVHGLDGLAAHQWLCDP